MDFIANTNELVSSCYQIDFYYNELMENIVRLKESLDTIKVTWIDESSKPFIISFESYIKQLEQLFYVYKRLSEVALSTIDRYMECDELSSKGAFRTQDCVLITR